MLRPNETEFANIQSAENRKRLAKMIMRLFDLWQIPVKEQASLLGLSSSGRTSVYRYKKGSPFADNQDLIGRAGHLLGIHKSLRIIFPHNKDMAYRWITQPNQRFLNIPPLEMMCKGYEGLLAVRRYLDFERGR